MSGEASDVAGRLARLEQRLGEVEDHLAIMQLIASYGPAVDGMDGQTLMSLWAADGSYDFGAQFNGTLYSALALQIRGEVVPQGLIDQIVAAQRADGS